MSEELLTVKQAAKYLKLSDRTVHKLIAEKKLLASQVGKRSWRLKQSDIDAFLQATLNFSEGDIENGC